MRATPFGADISGIELQATCVDNMLHSRFLIDLGDAELITIALIVALPILLALLSPRAERKLLAFFIPCAIGGGFTASSLYLFSSRNIQLNTLYPLLAICVSYLALSLHSAILHERRAAHLRKSVEEMGHAISSTLDITELFPRILDSVMRSVGADRGLLITCPGGGEGR